MKANVNIHFKFTNVFSLNYYLKLVLIIYHFMLSCRLPMYVNVLHATQTVYLFRYIIAFRSGIHTESFDLLLASYMIMFT